MLRVCRYLQGPEEGAGSQAVVFKSPVWALGTKLSSLEEQRALSTIEPSLQAHTSSFFMRVLGSNSSHEAGMAGAFTHRATSLARPPEPPHWPVPLVSLACLVFPPLILPIVVSASVPPSSYCAGLSDCFTFLQVGYQLKQHRGYDLFPCEHPPYCVNRLLFIFQEFFLVSRKKNNDVYSRLYRNIFLNLSCHIRDHKLTEVRAQSYQADNKHFRV